MPLQRLFHGLWNGSFGDPGLILEHGARATLVDCGDLRPLAPARIHRVRDVLLTHAHMDHAFGLDWLLRGSLGQDRAVRVVGPEGTAARVRARFDCYTWNIPLDFTIELEAWEVLPEEARARRTRFVLRDGVAPAGPPEDVALASEGRGVLLLEEDERRAVRLAPVDHGTPCLAFCYEGKRGARVRDADLARLGLPRGAWIRELKRALLRGAPAETPVAIDAAEGAPARTMPLGALAAEVAEVVAGPRIAYVSDTLMTPEVRARLLALCAGATTLYCEGKYLEKDREKAAASRHLTAREAALLARDAGARELVLFHPSPRYERDYAVILAEAREVFPEARFQPDPAPAPGT